MAVLGKRLKEAREKKRLTQIEAAKILGISNGTLSGYERNYRDPDTQTLESMANLYGVSTDYLLGRPDNTSTSTPNKDEIDIAKRMEKLRKDLASDNGALMFNGEPMSEEAMESLLEAMEYALRQTQRINKKYIPKKYRENQDQ